MSSKRKEYKVDARARKAALFFLACEPNPVARLSIPAAMRVQKGTLMRKVPIESSSSRCAVSPKKINPMILLVLSLQPRHRYSDIL